MIKQVKCTDCNWIGYEYELVRGAFTMGDTNGCCPSCGGDSVEDYEPSYGEEDE
ncbi:MAG: hypothetical protein ACLGPL_07135 [Acidobacteriota bacterium]